MKIYSDVDVMTAARSRVSEILSGYDRAYVAFSGGKDSSVVLHLAAEECRRLGRRMGCLVVDLEGQYRMTVEHVAAMLDSYSDVLDAHWVCLPLNLRNAVSSYEPYWCCWEPGCADDWVRPMPEHPAVMSDPDVYPFYKYRMEFEQFVPAFGEWYGRGGSCACMIGIRSDESLNRYRTIASSSKDSWNDRQWTTMSGNLCLSYPIYDWRTEDVWTANAREGWAYNRLYDLMYQAGLTIHQMRICQPYGDDQRIGLDMFRRIEPETWARVVNRVSGANYGNIYCGTKMLGYRKVELPPGHTWRSYAKLLLSSLPEATRRNYVSKFAAFIRYWKWRGCATPDEALGQLPAEAVITDEISSRGSQDKRIVRYPRIPDSAPPSVESRRLAPTWRRMAAAILKNDHLCKSIGFAQTADQLARQSELQKKYGGLSSCQ